MMSREETRKLMMTLSSIVRYTCAVLQNRRKKRWWEKVALMWPKPAIIV